MPKPKQAMSRRRPLGPQVNVQVTAEMINTAIRAHSGHCMIADAIRAAVPTARMVAVDLATARFSDPEKGLRYVYLTPRVAQEALIDFDEGHNPAPFVFKLRGAHVTRAGHPETKRTDGKKSPSRRSRAQAQVPQRATLHARNGQHPTLPDRIGGRRPPQLHVRREFGLRAFRAATRQLAEQQQPAIPDTEQDA